MGMQERVVKYESVYEEVTDEEDKGRVSFIKIYNVGQKVVTRRCSGMPAHMVLLNILKAIDLSWRSHRRRCSSVLSFVWESVETGKCFFSW